MAGKWYSGSLGGSKMMKGCEVRWGHPPLSSYLLWSWKNEILGPSFHSNLFRQIAGYNYSSVIWLSTLHSWDSVFLTHYSIKEGKSFSIIYFLKNSKIRASCLSSSKYFPVNSPLLRIGKKSLTLDERILYHPGFCSLRQSSVLASDERLLEVQTCSKNHS